MLTQQERTKIKEIIETKMASANEAMMQAENARSSNALLSIPGNQKKDAETLIKKTKIKFTLLQQALLSVNNDWYGQCNRCGNPIPFNKLSEAPEVTKCPNCL